MRHEFRYAFRTLKQNPGFTIVAVAPLALGIGANMAIFSVTNAVLVRSLPYPNSDRLVMIWSDNPKIRIGVTELPNSGYDFSQIRQSNVFQHAAVFRADNGNLSTDAAPYRVAGAR